MTFFGRILSNFLSTSSDVKNRKPTAAISHKDRYTQLPTRLRKEHRAERRRERGHVVNIGAPTDFQHIGAYQHDTRNGEPRATARPFISGPFPLMPRGQASLLENASLAFALNFYHQIPSQFLSHDTSPAPPHLHSRPHVARKPLPTLPPPLSPIRESVPAFQPIPPTTRLVSQPASPQPRNPAESSTTDEIPPARPRPPKDTTADLQAEVIAKQVENVRYLHERNKYFSQVRTLQLEMRTMRRAKRDLLSDKERSERLICFLADRLKELEQELDIHESRSRARPELPPTLPEASGMSMAPSEMLPGTGRDRDSSSMISCRATVDDAGWEAIDDDIGLGTIDDASSYRNGTQNAVQRLTLWCQGVDERVFSALEEFFE
ncbi:hypothetical protein EIP91_002742 [Steccherinum ochraceum]|uniref:Uncharacterized protein n=1 Tax=Steccherinum ochraceum TaxID=92696 RepID=A0A4R0RNE2_9APHY|nr:hypothetical protein EIP91_002742 [Steccherinum ochraceum]